MNLTDLSYSLMHCVPSGHLWSCLSRTSCLLLLELTFDSLYHSCPSFFCHPLTLTHCFSLSLLLSIYPPGIKFSWKPFLIICLPFVFMYVSLKFLFSLKLPHLSHAQSMIFLTSFDRSAALSFQVTLFFRGLFSIHYSGGA